MRGTAMANHFKKLLDSEQCLTILKGKGFYEVHTGIHGEPRVGKDLHEKGESVDLKASMPPARSPRPGQRSLPLVLSRRHVAIQGATATHKQLEAAEDNAPKKRRYTNLSALSDEEKKAHHRKRAAENKAASRARRREEEAARKAVEEAGRKGSSKEKGSSKKAKSTPKRKLNAKGEGGKSFKRGKGSKNGGPTHT